MISFNKLLPNGDRPVVWLPSNYKFKAGKPGVVMLPGTGTSWEAVFAREVMLNIAEVVTDQGYPLITSDCGVDEFGNARARSGIQAAIDYAQSSEVGVAPGKSHFWGFSQGGGAVLSYAANNPSQVISVGGVCPLVDMNILVEAGGSSKQFADNAYPPAYSEATHGQQNNPQTMAAAGRFDGMFMILCSSSNDGVIPPVRVQTFKDTVGDSAFLVDLGPVGHDNSVPNTDTAIAALLAQIGS